MDKLRKMEEDQEAGVVFRSLVVEITYATPFYKSNWFPLLQS